jgi:hypothetical protein
MSAEDFFYEHAGYSYDPATQTQEEGRRASARALARAEQYATDHGWWVTWEADPDQWDGDMPYDGPLWVALLMAEPDGPEPYHARGPETLATMGSIAIDSTDPRSEPYGRVVAAELALQATTEAGTALHGYQSDGTPIYGPAEESHIGEDN